jgi:polysaccharide biosynthesis protein PelE
MLSLPLAARHTPMLLEVGACVALGFGLPLPFLALHALATAAAVYLSVQRARVPDQRSAALATAALVLALPLVGAAIVELVAWPTWERGGKTLPAGTIEIALPSVSEDADGTTEAPPLEQEHRPIREVLSDSPPGAPRIDVVMALRNMEARRAVPLLKLALHHPSEDVRLLAFAIFERREKRLRTSIRALERRLAQLESRSPQSSAEHGGARARCHRRLAQHYWELCYGRFVNGDLEIDVLERAARHAQAAESLESDATTALLLARIHLRQRKAAEAWQYLERAERAGAHPGSSVPLFAEAAYALRRFEEIPRLLQRLQGSELCRPDLAEVAQFWTERRAS